jgi:hypothetical protein
VLSDAVRGFPSPSPWIYRSGGATLPKPHAVCINCRQLHPPQTSGPHHAETAGRMRVRIITVRQPKGRGGSSRLHPHVAHYARGSAA